MDAHSSIVAWTLSGQYDPDRPVLMDVANPTRQISRRKAIELVASLKGVFVPGSTVCLHLGNDILYPILCLAIWASHCIWTGSNTSYKVPELEYHLTLSNASYVIVSADSYHIAHEAVQNTGLRAQIILFSDLLETKLMLASTAGSHELCLHDLQCHSSFEDTLDRKPDQVASDSIAALLATSGTTGGLPKMAARTHRAIILETAGVADSHCLKPYEIRRLFCTPIFHTFSYSEMIVNSLRLGLPSYFMERFDITKWPMAVEKYAITETHLPPICLERLINERSSHGQLQSLRSIQVGGSHLSDELRSKWNAINFKGTPRIVQNYGMTEGGCFTTFRYPEEDITGAVGRPIPGVTFRVSERWGMAINGHNAGELCVSSAHLMQYYLGNPEETRKAFDNDGWLKTGDIGYCHGGKVYLVDRAKEMIKVNGFQVSPAEIEAVLQAMEGITESAVIGVDRNTTNEHPHAFVVRQSPGLSVDAVKHHLQQRLSSYKVAKLELTFISEIPRTMSGKAQKSKLQEVIGTSMSC